MNTSNLAERLEEFESVLDSLRLTSEPVTRVRIDQLVAEAQAVDELLKDDAGETPVRPIRRTRVRGIQLRDQGLRAFRVR